MIEAQATQDKMFDDDSFDSMEDLFNQFSRRMHSSRDTRENINSLLNTVELPRKTVLIFDLSGKKVSSVEISSEIEVNEYGQRIRGEQKILNIKFKNNETLKYGLPKALAKGKPDYTFLNGILEVSLKK